MADEITQGLIYQITSPTTDLVYIGSTTKPLSRRFSDHKASYKRWLEGRSEYITSVEILKFSDAKIELIEEFTCDNIQELRRREGEIIRQTENCVNKHIAGRTRQEYDVEYYQAKKDKLSERHAEYYEANKDKILKHQAEYYEANKDRRYEYNQANKDKIREWRVKHYEANKDKILEQRAKYRETNKAKFTEKHECPCGGRYTYSGKSEHFKTKLHKDYLNKAQKRITIEVDSDVDLIDDLDCLSLGYE